MSDLRRSPDDEVVSAYLDGEATPAERALVEGDPELLRRVEALRAIGRQAASTPAPSNAVREANVAAALAVFDNELAAPDHAMPVSAPPADQPPGVIDPAVIDPAVIDIEARRRNRLLPLLGAAAAVVLVVLVGVALLGRITSNSTDLDTAALAPSSSTSAPQELQVRPAPRVSQAAGPAPEAAPTTTQLPPTNTSPSAAGTAPPTDRKSGENASSVPSTYIGDLGRVAPGIAFRQVVVAKLDERDAAIGAGRPPATAALPTAAGASLTTCDAILNDSDSELGPLVLTASATANGKDAIVYAYEILPSVTNANGAYRAFVVGTDCSILDVQTV